jgi:hypothetical protein
MRDGTRRLRNGQARVGIMGREQQATDDPDPHRPDPRHRDLVRTRLGRSPRHSGQLHRPETILTEKNKAWIPEQQQQQLIQSHPLRRLGTPQDVAQAAVYLASDEASWITGVVLDISGGAVMV